MSYDSRVLGAAALAPSVGSGKLNSKSLKDNVKGMFLAEASTCATLWRIQTSGDTTRLW